MVRESARKPESILEKIQKFVVGTDEWKVLVLQSEKGLWLLVWDRAISRAVARLCIYQAPDVNLELRS